MSLTPDRKGDPTLFPHAHVPTVDSSTGARLFHGERDHHQSVLIGGIERDPDIWGGRAVIEGTRIPVFAVVREFAESDLEGVLETYPELTKADVYLAITYAVLDEEDVLRDFEGYLEEIPPAARVR